MRSETKTAGAITQINFMGDIELDFEWFKNQLPKDLNPALISESHPDHKSQGLFVYIHNWTVGRLNPDEATDNIKNAERRFNCKIDAVLVLRPAGHNGTEVALISVQGNLNTKIRTGIKVGFVAIDSCSIYSEDRERFFKMLKGWCSDHKPLTNIGANSEKPASNTNDFFGKIQNLFSTTPKKSDDAVSNEAKLSVKEKEQDFIRHCILQENYASLESFARAMNQKDYITAKAIITETQQKQIINN